MDRLKDRLASYEASGGLFVCVGKLLDGTKVADFRWTPQREKAALALAEGHTVKEAVARSGASDRSIWRWSANVEFRSEVDRLSLMVNIASRAERLRIAMRAARQSVRDEGVTTKEDVLAWLKFAQSETDGAKLDLAAVFAAMETTARDRGQPAMPSTEKPAVP